LRATASLLFFISLAISVAAAPNLLVAYDAAALLIAGLLAAWLVAWLARVIEPQALAGMLGVGAALAAGALSGYWLASSVWEGEPAGLLDQIARQWQAVRPTLELTERINDNVLASGLGVLIPLAVGGMIWGHRRRGTMRLIIWCVSVPALFLALAAVLLSNSRGAWLALAVAAVAGGFISVRRRLARRAGGWILVGDGALIILLALPALLVLATLILPAFEPGPLGGSVGAAATSRALLWREGLGLIADYRFTGSGLGATMMVLSTYVFILHVGYLGHVHNLFLEMALEQGVPGLIAYLCLAATAVASLMQAYQRRRVPSAQIGAVAASLAALYVHGLVDAGLYVSRLAPLVFLPIAAAWAVATPTHARADRSGWRLAARLAAALTPLLLVMALFAWPGARSAFQANLGAVAQSKAELSRYRWPEWPIQDALRRSAQIDLEPALARYTAALADDPDNITAHRRLGQIALSRGDWVQAQRHLEIAYRLAPGQNAGRLLLAEAFAMTGDAEAAADLLRRAETGAGQLDGRAWWISQVTGAQEQAWYAAARTLAAPPQ
jgi:cytochrome c-type biogenesis protein CcmH/NrfG